MCRKHGVSSATFYNWKAKYGALDVPDAKRLKALTRECLALGADTSLSGMRVARELDRLIVERGEAEDGLLQRDADVGSQRTAFTP